MQFNFGLDRFWNCLRKLPMRCNWYLAETIFGNVSEEFRWDAIENWLRQKLELSFKKSDEMQLNLGWDLVWKCLRINNKSHEKQLKFGWDRFWNCLRKIPMRCNWTLAQTKFGIAMKLFWWDAIESWLRQHLKPASKNFNEFIDWILARTQFGIVLEKMINPMRSNWILPGTEFGIAMKLFWWDAIEFWPRQDLELS